MAGREAVILVADLGGPTMFPRGIGRTSKPAAEEEEPADREA
jgi:hypothetical protein